MTGGIQGCWLFLESFRRPARAQGRNRGDDRWLECRHAKRIRLALAGRKKKSATAAGVKELTFGKPWFMPWDVFGLNIGDFPMAVSLPIRNLRDGPLLRPPRPKIR
jgi:hypothetical protein